MKQGRERFVALPERTKELIVMYRKEHKLTYRAIENRLDVSRETARLVCLDRIPEEKEKKLLAKKKRRTKKVVNKVVTKKRKPIPQYNSVRDYDFLQYIRVVMKWALQNNKDLSKGKLEMLLYLYPKGAFTYTKFHKYYKLIGLYQNRALAEFVDNDYVYVWRMPKGNQPKLYALTDKAKKLCDTMHRYCTGDEQLPIDETNGLTTDKTKRINNYYMDMIQDMNKRKKATD